MSSNDLALILSRLNIAELIGEHVALRQVGKTLKGLCPFHSERTPSFHVNPERGLWHCFGCNAGGNIVSFIMKTNNFSYPEAKDFLAKKAGITLGYPDSVVQKKRDRWYKILEAAGLYYQQMLLKSSPGKEGLEYLKSRGIAQSTIEKFKLGFAPFSSQALIKHLSQKNYEIQELREIGLATKSDPPRDYFFKRIIFPIWDYSGIIVGFGGRIIEGEGPKYLNSPDTPLFKKGETLYALHFAKAFISKEGHSLLTEGYMDVLMLHQSGFNQAVATLGTSLTLPQTKILSRFAPKILVCYDADQAGLEAMQRAMAIAENVQVDLAFIQLPSGEDPDSFLKKEGKEKFYFLLNKSLSPFDFLFQRTRKKYDENSPEGKRKILREVTPLLKKMRDPVLRDAYIAKATQELGVAESAFRKILSQGNDNLQTKGPSLEANKLTREHEILSWLVWEPSVSDKVWSVLFPSDFKDSLSKELATLFYQSWQEGKTSLLNLDGISEEILSLMSKLSAHPPIGSVKFIDELLHSQKSYTTKREIETLKSELSKRLKEGKVDTTDEAYQKYLTLLRQVKRQGDSEQTRNV